MEIGSGPPAYPSDQARPGERGAAELSDGYADAPVSHAPSRLGVDATPARPGRPTPTAPGARWHVDLADCIVTFPIPIFVFPLCCCGWGRMLHRANICTYMQAAAATTAACVVYLLFSLAMAGLFPAPVEIELEDGQTITYREYSVAELARNALPHVFFWLVVLWSRMQLVKRYGINESVLLSVVTSCFFGTCALGQQIMHVDIATAGVVDASFKCEVEHPAQSLEAGPNDHDML